MANTNIVPVIMSGGAGTRLWPASRKAAPKQLLSLVGDDTMLQSTAHRLSGRTHTYSFGAPVIVCNGAHAQDIYTQLDEIGIRAGQIITEPVPRNTAPCATIAAMAVQRTNPDALMLLAPADHHISNPKAFSQVIENGLSAALAGYLVTFGITAKTPQTGYGYIQKGEKLDQYAHIIAAFKEKPDSKTAKQYVKSGAYFWNAGIFMCKPSVYLAEMKIHSREIFAACERTFATSTPSNSDYPSLPLNAQSFAACPSDSIDYAVMEHTSKAAVVEADMGWSDIGSWSALLELTRTGAMQGNATKGDVHLIDTKSSLVHSDGPFVATIGVENLAVIVHDGAVLVANMDKVQNTKDVVAYLKSQKKTDKL